jgi:hypothetical protein
MQLANDKGPIGEFIGLTNQNSKNFDWFQKQIFGGNS